MFPSIVLAAALATSNAAAIEAAFARWETAAREMKSLHVEYTVTETTPGGRETSLKGTLRMLRTDDGLLAELKTETDDRPHGRFLLHKGAVYATNDEQKRATRFPTDDVTRFLTDYFHPLVVLLDRERAEKAFTITVEKKDDWFVFLALTPKNSRSDQPTGMVVVPHRKNTTMPVGMPAAIRTQDGSRMERWNVTKWVMNGENPPKAEDFALPSEKDGWTISEWTWPPKWITADKK